MFIDHYYLKLIDNDLKTNKLSIKSTDYEKLSELNFEHEDLKHIIFENRICKWIKLLDSTTYLVTFDLVFQILNNGGQNLSFKKLIYSNEPISLQRRLLDCETSTLKIGNDIFCFSEKTYFPISEDKFNGKFEIKDIFREVPGVSYESYEQLELIFHYKDNRFVLMTQQNLSIIHYDLIEVRNFMIFFNYSKANIKIVKIENCILKNCNKKYGRLFIVLLIAIVLIIFLITCYFINLKMDNLILSKVYFGLSKLNSSFITGKYRKQKETILIKQTGKEKMFIDASLPSFKTVETITSEKSCLNLLNLKLKLDHLKKKKKKQLKCLD